MQGKLNGIEATVKSITSHCNGAARLIVEVASKDVDLKFFISQAVMLEMTDGATSVQCECDVNWINDNTHLDETFTVSVTTRPSNGLALTE